MFKSKIPFILYKTGKVPYKDLPKGILKLFNETIKNNPGLKIEYYDDIMCREFIKDNFDKNVLHAYDKLKPTAYKADLFRYCLLFKRGGIWSDLTDDFLIPLDESVHLLNSSHFLLDDLNLRQNLNE